MKKKKSIYILLPAALLVWGMVFYKVISGFGGGGSVAAEKTVRPLRMFAAASRDTFPIVASYRDPFLDYVEEEKVQEAAIVSAPPPPIVIWPGVEYLGMIKPRKGSKVSVMLKIDGNEYLGLEGTEVKGIKIMKACRDSVLLKYSDLKKGVRLFDGKTEKPELGFSR